MRLSDGVIYCEYKPEVDIKIEQAKLIVADRVALCNGETYPLLVNVSELKSINKEAREYISGEKGIELLSAGAFLVDNQVAKFIGNFFIKINKPKLPARLFTNEEKALQWLEQFRQRD